METRVPAERWIARRVHWIGMGCVYGGTLVLLGLLAFHSGLTGAAVAGVGIRAAATAALGVGICGQERWAWATSVCLAVLHLSIDGVLSLCASWKWVTLPATTLSWQPVFHGLNADYCGRVALGSGSAAVAAGLVLYALWTAREQFDVPYRRAFTTLSREGALPAIALAAVDLYVILGWWLSSARGPIL